MQYIWSRGLNTMLLEGSVLQSFEFPWNDVDFPQILFRDVTILERSAHWQYWQPLTFLLLRWLKNREMEKLNQNKMRCVESFHRNF